MVADVLTSTAFFQFGFCALMSSSNSIATTDTKPFNVIGN